MLFRRRVAPGRLEKLRVAVWPRRSFGRSARYFIHRIKRISATPNAIAAGVAAGIFSSFTPFMGFHILLACALAYVVGGNLLAAVLGTVLGNPLTFPLIWAATYEVGRLILGGPGGGPAVSQAALTTDLVHQSFGVLLPLIEPMLVGAVPVALPFTVLFYYLTRSLVRSYQDRRRARLKARIEAAEQAVIGAPQALGHR